MNKLFCRTFQFVMKIGNYFLGYKTPTVINGEGCLNTLPSHIKNNNLNNVLVVTDNMLLKLGLLDNFFEELKKQEIKYVLFSEVIPNPTDTLVERGYELFKENKCEAIVAIGGGSPMDCAKAIAAKNAHPNKKISQLQGILKVHKKIVPFYAVPTTAGTGSETTVAAVITIEKTHHKASINDPSIIPHYAVLDPLLTVGLPPQVTSTTGMDALCHAIESYTNYTYTTKLERDYSKKAVKLIYDNLLIAYEDGRNIEARENMQLAAFYAGRSFTRGCVGYVHAIGHTLGGLYGVAHGLAMSAILPYVLRAYGDKVYDRLADLADICGFKGTNKQKALAFIEWIEDSNKKMNIPDYLDMIKEEDVNQIIDWAIKEGNPLYPVPVIWDREDFRKVIDELRRTK